MKNLAGNEKCDDYIPKELEFAGIPYERFSFKMRGEVPSNYIGFLDGWKFERAWYYWVATSEKNVLLFKYAEELHEKHGKEVRVAGHCCCPSPREWGKEPWCIGVSSYHVDTQEGLKALADTIKKQTQNPCETIVK